MKITQNPIFDPISIILI